MSPVRARLKHDMLCLPTRTWSIWEQIVYDATTKDLRVIPIVEVPWGRQGAEK